MNSRDVRRTKWTAVPAKVLSTFQALQKGPCCPQEDPERGRGTHRPRQHNICLDFSHQAHKIESKPMIRYLLQKTYDGLISEGTDSKKMQTLQRYLTHNAETQMMSPYGV